FISTPSTSFEFEDDDFVGDFSGAGGAGSVLGYEEDLPVGGGRSRKTSNPRKKAASGRSGNRTARAKPSTRRSSKSSTKGTSKPARGARNATSTGRSGTTKRGSPAKKKTARGKNPTLSKGRPGGRSSAGTKKGKRPSKPTRKRR
ncbi:MAG: hypothetical protein AAGG44_10740, partial [Planctomycetota bacterium]